MSTLEFLVQIALAVLAVLAGAGVGKAGVLTGRAGGSLDVTVWRWRVVWRSLQIRPDKAYFQAVVMAA